MKRADNKCHCGRTTDYVGDHCLYCACHMHQREVGASLRDKLVELFPFLDGKLVLPTSVSGCGPRCTEPHPA